MTRDRKAVRDTRTLGRNTTVDKKTDIDIDSNMDYESTQADDRIITDFNDTDDKSNNKMGETNGDPTNMIIQNAAYILRLRMPVPTQSVLLYDYDYWHNYCRTRRLEHNMLSRFI